MAAMQELEDRLKMSQSSWVVIPIFSDPHIYSTDPH